MERPEWICPECGDQAVRRRPVRRTYRIRPDLQLPTFSHTNGTPLCPVIGGDDGCQPAAPAHLG